ncbi:TPA: hypothetical protein ACH3X1_010635 [Trebouxia sp. C0004]
MQSGRQCAGASTTGRVGHEFGHHCYDHCPRLSVLSLRASAHGIGRRSLLFTSLARQSLTRKASTRCEPPGQGLGQQRCRQKRSTICAASGSCAEPDSDRRPSRYHYLRSAALCSVIFGVWCCVSAHTQASSAFLSMTSALTEAGASSAAAHGAVRSGYAGLAAGCLHSLAGVDHLAALTPFTIGRSHAAASLLGALWGFGHSTGQLIMGLVMIILKDRFQHIVPTLNKLGNTTVGLTLILIGVLGIIESRQHQQQQAEQLQPATTEGTVIQDISKKQPGKSGLRHSMGIFATGVVYGCNPDALFCVIPAITLPTKLAAATYTAMFVLGTVGAMGGYTAFIGAVSRSASDEVNSKLATIASMIALVVGAGVLLSGFGVALPVSFSLA